jgi:Uma2 family endonuclease
MSAVLEIQQTASEQNTNGVSTAGVKPHPISVAVYDKMIEHGIFDENDNLELLNGVLIEKMTKGIRHAALNDLLGDLFREKLGNKIYVRLQNPIVLDDFSEPESDVVLAKPPRQTYFKRHPKPEDIFLVLEISDSTVAYDRNTKAAAYARAGIQQYLLLNLQNETLEDYREASADGYQFKQTLRAGQTFELVAFPEFEFNVSEFLPSTNE